MNEHRKEGEQGVWKGDKRRYEGSGTKEEQELG